MQTLLIFDATNDYLTTPKGVVMPLDEAPEHWAIRAVQVFSVNGFPLGDRLDNMFMTMRGKDGGWHLQEEADGSITVERRFTEKRGMSYVPLTWAFSVSKSGHEPHGAIFVEPANDRATTLMTRAVSPPLDH